MNIGLCGFGLYFFIVGAIAIISSLAMRGKASAYSQMMLGNRSVNYFLTALSAHASDMSDWVFMAFPAYVYTKGGVGYWIAFGLMLGMWLTWKYIAPRLRTLTQEYDVLTLAGYFEARFNDRSGVLRILIAVICFLFFSVYIAAGLKGFGYLGESLFQIPYHYGVCVAIVAMMLYAMVAGYRGLAMIDAFQALFLLLAIIIVPVLVWFKVGGYAAVESAIHEHGLSLSVIPSSYKEWINAIFIALSWAVGYFGMPHILTKFMGISRVSEMKKAQYLGLSWQCAVMTASGLIGLLAHAYFSGIFSHKELVFIAMAQDMFSPFTAGIILSAVAGATLAATSAQVLVLISVVVEDLYHGIIHKHASAHRLLWVYRATVVAIACVSLLVSFDRSSTIQSLVQYAWMGFGCSFGPLMVMSLYMKNITKKGAIAGVVSGASIAATWQILCYASVVSFTGLEIPAVIPGFLASSLFIYLFSRI